MKATLLGAVALGSMFFAGCQDEHSQQKIQNLESRVQKLEQTNKQLADSAESADLKVAYLMELQSQRKVAGLVTSEKSYQPMDSSVGPLLVICDSIDPYLDGHKAHLRIYNPLNITFAGFTLKAEYGRPLPERAISLAATNALAGFAAMGAWRATLKEHQSKFTESLTPGDWTKVDLVVTPSRPQEMAYLGISVEVGEIVTVTRH